MGHLTKEALARLVSEAPSQEEKRHLDDCSVCREELRLMMEQTELLGSLPDLRPPAGDWEALEARLVSEGLIRTSGIRRRTSGWWSSGWSQAAAALVLFLGGAAMGSGLMTSADGRADQLPGGSSSGLELIPVGTQTQPVSDLADAVAAVNVAEQQYMLALLQYRQLLDSQGQPNYLPTRGHRGHRCSRKSRYSAGAGRSLCERCPGQRTG
jgi:hypothetical protein